MLSGDEGAKQLDWKGEERSSETEFTVKELLHMLYRVQSVKGLRLSRMNLSSSSFLP